MKTQPNDPAQLELKHLAPYLPYGLTAYNQNFGTTKLVTVSFDSSGTVCVESVIEHDTIKPILRHMSDLATEIEHDGERFSPIHKLLESYCFDVSKMDEDEILSYRGSLIEVDLSYQTAIMLFEWHFDVFSLIPAGLAVDINALTGQELTYNPK